MERTILIIIAIVAVALLFRKSREAVAGICAVALDQTVRKNTNKEKALAFLRERSASAQGSGETKGEASNAELRSHLGVSERTVVRYLDELEKEGKVEQVGRVGHAVTYRLK